MRTPTRHEGAHGVTWKVRFRLDGKQTSETFTTKRAAEQFCRDLTDLGPAQARRRLEEEHRRSNAPTMNTLWDQFIEWKTPRVRSDRTIAEYQASWRNWLQPTFGDQPADTVTSQDVQAWVDKMVDGSLTRTGHTLSAKSVHVRHALLHAVFKYASAPSRRIVDVNPCIGTDLPKKMPTPPKAIMPAEWHALRAALAQIDPDAADIAEYLLATGWRWSEGIALNTYDVEDYGDIMFVTMRHVARRNAHNRWEIVEDVKAEGSGRRIRLDQDAAALVRRRMLTATPGGLVFTRAGKQWHYVTFSERIWHPAVKAANLSRRPTVHWLRHSLIYWGSMSGANLAELSSRIGHRHISTTIDVYGRAINDVQPDVLERMAALRRGQKTPAIGGTQ